MFKQYRNAQTSRVAGGLALALMFLASACSNSDTPAAMPDLAPPPPDLAPGVYPAAPYGPNEGDVLPNFTFQGYYSPTSTMALASTQPFGEVTFDEVRLSGAKLALLQLSAFW